MRDLNLNSVSSVDKFSQTKRVSIDTVLWLLVAFTLPFQQLLYVIFSQNVRYFPLLVGIIGVLLGRVYRVNGFGILIGASFLILAAGFISGSNSNVPSSTLVATSFVGFVLFTSLSLSFQIRHFRWFTKTMLVLFLVAHTLSIGVAFAQAVGIDAFGLSQRGGRVNGLAYHPNVLGIISVLVVLFLTGFIFKNRGSIVWAGFLILANLYAIVLSGSLSSLLALLAGLAIFLNKLGVWERFIVLFYSFVALLFVFSIGTKPFLRLLPDFTQERMRVVLGEQSGGVASAEIRFQTYNHALSYISRDPVVGVGMDSMNQSTVALDLVVHNYLLRGWYQGGFLLFVGFLVLTIYYLWQAQRLARFGHLEFSSIIVALFAFALTSAFYTQSNYWLPIIFCGVLASLRIDLSLL